MYAAVWHFQVKFHVAIIRRMKDRANEMLTPSIFLVEERKSFRIIRKNKL